MNSAATVSTRSARDGAGSGIASACCDRGAGVPRFAFRGGGVDTFGERVARFPARLADLRQPAFVNVETAKNQLFRLAIEPIA